MQSQSISMFFIVLFSSTLGLTWNNDQNEAEKHLKEASSKDNCIKGLTEHYQYRYQKYDDVYKHKLNIKYLMQLRKYFLHAKIGERHL